jgi:mycothiol synthase
MGLSARPPAIDDAPAVIDLVNSCTRADVGMAVYEPADLGSEWAARGADLEVVTDDGVVVGYLETDPHEEGPYFEGFVHPARRGEGIGSRLAASAEERASVAGAATITTNVGSENAARFFESRGYVIVEREYAMFLDLDHPSEVSVPKGVQLRVFVEGADEGAMHEAIRDSFGDDWPDSSNDPAAWMLGHQSVRSYDPNLWLFAESGGQIVGAVMNRTHWHAQRDTGWVKNLGVRKEWRGRGIGRALLLESARLFHERGKRRLVLGVHVDNPTGAPDFYRRVGMRIGGASWDLRRSL